MSTPTSIHEAFLALSDGQPISADPELDPRQAEGVRLLAHVRDVFRDQLQYREPSAERAPAFVWGPLRVYEQIGQGGYGTVYRAHDPWLARDVALKLFDAARYDSGRLIEEARRLARLRHPHVVMVHGAATHEGRVGFWCECIEGQTLASLLERDGAFSVSEALRVAYELALALVAVHGIGLVHGDVKAQNIMRERGGRIVLMDFGASDYLDAQAAKRWISGTPRDLPPEVLAGADLSPQSDWYAFGNLLRWLLSGQHPFADISADQLLEAKQRPVAPLLSIKPDLPAALATWVDTLIAPEPAQRPNPTAILAALAKPTQWFDNAQQAPGAAPTPQLTAPTQRGVRTNRWWAWPLGALVVALLTWAGWRMLDHAPLKVDAEFVGVGSQGEAPLNPDSALAIDQRFYLRLHSNRPAFIYVLNEDADGVATVLYPYSGATQPLAAGAAIRLPGGLQSRLTWQITSGSAYEEFLVIAATRPLPELESIIADWRTVQTSVRSAGALVENGVGPMILGAKLITVLATFKRAQDDDAWVQRYRFQAQRQSPVATNAAQ